MGETEVMNGSKMTTQRHDSETPVGRVHKELAAILFPHRGWIGSILRPCSRMLLPATVATMLFSLASPLANAAPSPEVLTLANYAVATATHDRPAHVVTAADVSNALATFNRLNSQLTLGYNLGNLLGTPFQIALFNSNNFTSTCVNFPDSIGGVPKIVPCSNKAVAAWQSLPLIFDVSRRAVAVAASHGRAVAGTDVVIVAGSGSTSLAPKPTFRAGQGGKVRFMTKLKTGTTTSQVFVCVQFPKTAYGIPSQVAC